MKLGRLIVLQVMHTVTIKFCYLGNSVVEYYYKESNISGTNWLRYIAFFVFDQNLVEFMTSSFC